MRHIDEDAEVSLRNRLPQWIEAVDDSSKDNVDYITVMLDALRDDSELLYNALWYAYSKGVDVLVIGPQNKDKKANKPLKTAIYLREA